MVFNVVSGTQSVIGAETTLTVYPNPASDYISIKNSVEGLMNVRIYSLDGAVLLTAQIFSSSQQINVSSLSKGFYLLKVNNQALKFMKL